MGYITVYALEISVCIVSGEMEDVHAEGFSTPPLHFGLVGNTWKHQKASSAAVQLIDTHTEHYE